LLHFQISPSSGVPVYRQVMDQVRYYVAGGQLKAGDRLPSIREMAGALHINPTTIVKAYNELQHGGDIEMKHGKGAFITEASEPRSRAEVETEFRRLCAALAASALQMGLGAERAAGILAEEIGRLGVGGKQ